MSKTQGFGLIEVLISLFITSLILFMLGQFYLSTKEVYLNVEQQLEDALDLKWVGDQLSNSVRQAGYTPCLAIDYLDSIDTRNGLSHLSGLKLKHSEFIQVNRMNEQFTSLATVENPSQISISKKILLNTHRPIIIADCDHAEVHQLQSVRQLGEHFILTLSQPLQFKYKKAYVGEWLEERWYIQTNINGKNSLFYQLGQSVELSPLVHSLQIKEGNVHQQRVLNIALGIDNAKTRNIQVVVRSI